MNGEKSSLRKKLLIKRKKLFSKKLTFNFGKIVNFWRPKYFEDLLNRLETNSDIDPMTVEFDKKKF